MANIHAFRSEGQTVKVTAGIATGGTAVQVHPGTSKHIRVHNSGTVAAFVAFGGIGAVAVIPVVGTPAWGTPVPAGAVEIFTAANGYVAAITPSATADLYFTPGEGV